MRRSGLCLKFCVAAALAIIGCSSPGKLGGGAGGQGVGGVDGSGGAGGNQAMSGGGQGGIPSSQGQGGASQGEGGAVPGGVVQLDVSAALIHDTVLNDGTGRLDPEQNPLDASGYVLMTLSAAIAVGGPSAAGLPNDGIFKANASHPDVQLHWNNADDGPNSRVMTRGDSFVITAPKRPYKQVQLYGLSTEGASTLQITLSYSDGTADVRTINFPDWTSPMPGAGQFFLIEHLDRYGSGIYDPIHTLSVSGVDLRPDPTKPLLTIIVAHTSAARFAFYGATGW